MNDPALIKESLLQLSHELGNPEKGLAILGEGNTSARLSEDAFLVKASGSRLCDLREDQLVEVRFDRVLPLLDATLSDQRIEEGLLKARVDFEAPKPSVETTFHAWLLTQPEVGFVGHTHPIAVNQILCSPLAETFANRRLFPDEVVCCGPRSLLVEYADPGCELAFSIRRHWDQFVKESGINPRLILIKNHGLLALGPSASAVLAATSMATKAAEIFTGAASLGGPVFMNEEEVMRIASRADEFYRQRQLGLV